MLADPGNRLFESEYYPSHLLHCKVFSEFLVRSIRFTKVFSGFLVRSIRFTCICVRSRLWIVSEVCHDKVRLMCGGYFSYLCLSVVLLTFLTGSKLFIFYSIQLDCHRDYKEDCLVCHLAWTPTIIGWFNLSIVSPQPSSSSHGLSFFDNKDKST